MEPQLILKHVMMEIHSMEMDVIVNALSKMGSPVQEAGLQSVQ
jgi:hypothetical protein